MNDNRTIKNDELLPLLINPELTRNNKHYLCDCLFCAKKKHFYINVVTQLWDCKHCLESGNVFQLLFRLGKLELLERKTINIRRLPKLGEIHQIRQEISLDLNVPNHPKLAGFKRIYENEYITKRGFKTTDFEKYVIGKTGILNRFKDYVVIAVRDDDGGTKGYVTRNLIDDDRKRYLNIGSEFSKLLFGIYEDYVEGVTNTVILTEGIFDKKNVDNVFHLDDNDYVKCWCSFGKKVSEYQVAKMLRRGIRNLILLYDPDAYAEAKRYSGELKKSFNVFVGKMVDNDPGDASPEELNNVFNNLFTPLNFSISTVNKLKH